MAQTIKCTECGHELEITEAIKKELEGKILKEAEKKHEEELHKLHKQQEEELEKLSKKAREEAIEKVRKQYDAKIEATKEESEAKDKENSELQQQLKETLQGLREAKSAQKKTEIEYEKKLLAEQDKIKAKAKEEVEEEMELKIAEKNKKLSDAEKQIKELQRKIQQGSQQTQGEVLELELEELIAKEFPFDEVGEVGKGVRGADVIQTVKTRSGATCGTIVWESKNTKNWTEGWVAKLKEDQRNLKAEIAVLVTKALPEDISTFGFRDGIWITDRKSAISLAHALRQQLIRVRGIQEASKGKASKAEVVYDYLISNDFRQRIEVWVEYFEGRKAEIDKEKLYYMKKWEKEEKSIMKVMGTTAGIYGDLQGLIGSALPKVQSLELPEEISDGE